MKKIKIVSSLLLSAVLLFPVLASADSLSSGVEESIQKESVGIADSYIIGEKLSEEDLQFILDNAHKVENTQSKSVLASSPDTWSIFGMSRNSDNTVEGDIYGDVTVDVGFVSVTVSGDLDVETVRGSYKVSAAKANYRFVGYGIISTESPYVGKVADWTQSGSGTTSATVGISKTTYAAVSLYQMFPEGSLTFTGGTLNLSGTATKQ
ncbi:hypothetical protein D3C76_1031710 [compost metagenome]